jgi:virulence-associated protein VagC
VDLTVQDNQLIIQPARKPRQDWEAQFARMAEVGDDQLLDSNVPTHWDETEWTW